MGKTLCLFSIWLEMGSWGAIFKPPLGGNLAGKKCRIYPQTRKSAQAAIECQNAKPTPDSHKKCTKVEN